LARRYFTRNRTVNVPVRPVRSTRPSASRFNSSSPTFTAVIVWPGGSGSRNCHFPTGRGGACTVTRTSPSASRGSTVNDTSPNADGAFSTDSFVLSASHRGDRDHALVGFY